MNVKITESLGRIPQNENWAAASHQRLSSLIRSPGGYRDCWEWYQTKNALPFFLSFSVPIRLVFLLFLYLAPLMAL